MVFITDNFKNDKEICACGQNENLEHIYKCELWNRKNINGETKFEEIFKDNISNQVKISKRIFNNLEKREKFKVESHMIQSCDPPQSVVEGGNGV